ncbi:prepilin-type N-terminal cleavage/methylation domain-containing protein [Candidatus Saccharibacteria bacterium]|nr:prepilin-type N-terminal cleavage/methylation domain-containing protein [Candidatus Saccharibacteria bacterium]
MIKRTDGFTIIELVVVMLVLAVASLLFFMQKQDLQIASRDEQRKTAINAMYYSLEEVFYKTNNYYPTTINQTNLPSVEPTLFTDPTGIKLGEPESNYRYEPVNCTDNKCASYTLRTTLENEADFIKESKSK